MLQFSNLKYKFYFVFAMFVFFVNVANDGNKLTTLLGSQTSILEEFVL